MARLAAGLAELRGRALNRPDVNMVFARVDGPVADRLAARGLHFYRMGPGIVRFVTSWQTTDADIDLALAAFA